MGVSLDLWTSNEYRADYFPIVVAAHRFAGPTGHQNAAHGCGGGQVDPDELPRFVVEVGGSRAKRRRLSEGLAHATAVGQACDQAWCA
jgi:hypothetical protein